MPEQDDAPGAPAGDADAGPAAPPTAADGWLTAAPREPEGPRCPWCSAPLPDPAAERCGTCGAHLAGAPDQPIPGLTSVAPPAPRGSTPQPATRRRRSVLSWITGDMDLVDVPPPVPSPGGPVGGAESGTPDPRGPVGPISPDALGPTSPDALAPPDARLRLEMIRMELEALGLAPDDMMPEVDATPALAAPGDEHGATGAAGDVPAADGPATDGPSDGRPAGADAPGPA